MNIIESMAIGLPIVATKCRGHNDLIQNGKNGYLVDYSAIDFSEKMAKILTNDKMIIEFSKCSKELARYYDLDFVKNQISRIYFENNKSKQ